ncbi:flavoprotein [Streptomyces xiamenensis]
MTNSRVLYLIACAAPPTLGIRTGVLAAQRAGWEVCLVLTPSAGRWLAADMGELTDLTGFPVRTDYKVPGQADALPPAGAVLLAPATFNTFNKWALGITDTLALGLLAEAIGLRLPTVAVPYLKPALAAHPAYPRSVETLRGAGVTVLSTGGRADPGGLSWTTALDALP